MKIGMDAYYLNKPKTSIGIFQYIILKNITKRNDLEIYIYLQMQSLRILKIMIMHISLHLILIS